MVPISIHECPHDRLGNLRMRILDSLFEVGQTTDGKSAKLLDNDSAHLGSIAFFFSDPTGYFPPPLQHGFAVQRLTIRLERDNGRSATRSEHRLDGAADVNDAGIIIARMVIPPKQLAPHFCVRSYERSRAVRFPIPPKYKF